MGSATLLEWAALGVTVGGLLLSVWMTWEAWWDVVTLRRTKRDGVLGLLATTRYWQTVLRIPIYGAALVWCALMIALPNGETDWLSPVTFSGSVGVSLLFVVTVPALLEWRLRRFFRRWIKLRRQARKAAGLNSPPVVSES